MKKSIEIDLGTDLANFTIDELYEWIAANKGVHYDPAMEGYLIHSQVVGYTHLLIQAQERGKVVQPTILSLEADYKVVKPKK